MEPARRVRVRAPAGVEVSVAPGAVRARAKVKEWARARARAKVKEWARTGEKVKAKGIGRGRSRAPSKLTYKLF